jgi:hypothetical protein
MRFGPKFHLYDNRVNQVSFAKTLRGHKSRRATMLQDHPHAIHFKHILYFGEGQELQVSLLPTQQFSGSSPIAMT